MEVLLKSIVKVRLDDQKVVRIVIYYRDKEAEKKDLEPDNNFRILEGNGLSILVKGKATSETKKAGKN